VTLAPGASEVYNTSYELTQADLDSQGGGDGDIDNTATADSNETGPVYASAEVPLVFGPAEVPLAFDGLPKDAGRHDGKSDIIWQNPTGDPEMLMGYGTFAAPLVQFSPWPTGELQLWKIKATGDFNGDGDSEIIWQHDSNNLGSNVTFAGAVGPFNPGADWQIKGVGDFDGDGKSDIIWQQSGGQAAMWLMDGTDTTFVGAVGPFNPGASWHIEDTGDFNDDGKSDILWRDNNGLVAEWHMDGTEASWVGAVGSSTPGEDLFTGDFNAGGEVDWSVYSKTDSYETVFGIDAGGNLDGDQLLAVLNQPVQGNPEVTLAYQAVTALLNATDDTGMVTQGYRFSTDEVIAAVQEVYDDGGFDAQQGADLTNLLQFWNEAPEANVGAGATVPGELHSDDTTIATTLQYNGTAGGSFARGIFAVLDGLYPTHDWL
jgi:hypothetical protein